MKNQILCFSLLLFCISCNKSVENSLTFEEKILGAWQVNSFVINSCPNIEDNVALVTSNDDGCLSMMDETTCMTIILSENGKAEIHQNEGTISSLDVETLTYELDEANNSIKLQQEFDDTIIFSLKDDVLSNEMDEEGCICIFGFKKT